MSQEQIETAARAIFLANPLCEPSMVDACWDLYEDEARAVIAAIHPTVRTVEELDALPVGSVVLSYTVFLKVKSGLGREVWGCVGTSDIIPADEILVYDEDAGAYSVTVLRTPGAAA